MQYFFTSQRSARKYSSRNKGDWLSYCLSLKKINASDIFQQYFANLDKHFTQRFSILHQDFYRYNDGERRKTEAMIPNIPSIFPNNATLICDLIRDLWSRLPRGEILLDGKQEITWAYSFIYSWKCRL